jgi:hypothetical protein
MKEIYFVIDEKGNNGHCKVLSKYTLVSSARRYVTNYLKEKYGKYKSRELTRKDHNIRIILCVYDNGKYTPMGYCN